MQIYLVGGAVRDRLLGVEPRDRDWVVVGATPEQMLQQGFRPVGKDFPVFLHPETNEEYALARTERKSGHGYHGFSFHTSVDVTLEQDLQRRDLTINAMAMDSNENLIDPYGGEEDLAAGKLRHVSAAFREDPLRILRIARYAARFQQWGFYIAHGTHNLMKKMVADGEVDHLVAERIWQETNAALQEKDPQRYFEVLHKCGALRVVFPEIDGLFGVPQSPHSHPEVDCGIHVMMVLQQAAKLSADTRVRFAALVHDLGKATTPQKQWPKHPQHEERGIALVQQLCSRMKVPNEYRELALLVAEYHGLYHKAGEVNAAELYHLLEALDIYRRPERLEPFLQACEADSRGRSGFEDQYYDQPDIIRNAYACTVTVTATEVMRDGFIGADIRQEIARRRVAILQQQSRLGD